MQDVLLRLVEWLAGYVADIFKAFFAALARWWGISLAAITVLITACASSISFLKDMFTTMCVMLESALGNVQGLNPGDPFGGQFTDAVATINAFIPLTEIFAGIITLANLWALMWMIRFVEWLIKTLKWIFFILAA
jgi:hypothetical protein